MPQMRLATRLSPLVESSYQVPEQAAFEMKVFAAQAAPYEGCGVIHEDGSVTRVANIFAGNRRHGFEMDIDLDFGVPVVAIWHSHPGGRPFMSDRDHIGMCEMYRMGVKLPWVIVAHGEVTAWELSSD